jgi:hypothetical protein
LATRQSTKLSVETVGDGHMGSAHRRVGMERGRPGADPFEPKVTAAPRGPPRSPPAHEHRERGRWRARWPAWERRCHALAHAPRRSASAPPAAPRRTVRVSCPPTNFSALMVRERGIGGIVVQCLLMKFLVIKLDASIGPSRYRLLVLLW